MALQFEVNGFKQVSSTTNKDSLNDNGAIEVSQRNDRSYIKSRVGFVENIASLNIFAHNQTVTANALVLYLINRKDECRQATHI